MRCGIIKRRAKQRQISLFLITLGEYPFDIRELHYPTTLYGIIMIKEHNLIELSKQFAVDVVFICKRIREQEQEKILTAQLIRSGTSVGANIHEGNYASSRLDFINKFQIALKECFETEYWLDIMKRTGYLALNDYDSLYTQCSKIRKMLTTSITTAKQNI